MASKLARSRMLDRVHGNALTIAFVQTQEALAEERAEFSSFAIKEVERQFDPLEAVLKSALRIRLGRVISRCVGVVRF